MKNILDKFRIPGYFVGYEKIIVESNSKFYKAYYRNNFDELVCYIIKKKKELDKKVVERLFINNNVIIEKLNNYNDGLLKKIKTFEELDYYYDDKDNFYYQVFFILNSLDILQKINNSKLAYSLGDFYKYLHNKINSLSQVKTLMDNVNIRN